MAKGQNTLTLTVNDQELNNFLKNLAEVVGNATRPVAQAGAEVMYQEARRLAPVGQREYHYFYGTSWKPTKGNIKIKYKFYRGSLRNSVYQAYSKDRSGPLYSTYHVSWNYEKAPYAGFVEWGTPHMAGTSFIRAARLSKYNDALAAMRAKFNEIIMR